MRAGHLGLLLLAEVASAACGGSTTTSRGGEGGVPFDANDRDDATTREDALLMGDGGSDLRDGAKHDSSGGADAGTNLDARDGDAEVTLLDGEAACNALVPAGQPVTGTFIPAEAPSAAGGTVGSGTYHLSKFSMYTGPGGESGNANGMIVDTVEISGGSLASASATLYAQSDGGTSGQSDVYSSSGTFMTSGTSFAASITCPGLETATMPYTATSTSLALFETLAVDGGAVIVVTVFAKQ